MVRSPCCDKEHISRGAWNKEEDELLSNYIKKHGISNWRMLPKAAGLSRCGKSCRLRWINYLRPDLKRGNFTEHEDELIIYLHSLIGNKWSIIAARLQGRTDNEIKNHWNTHIRRKLLYRGIDPKTHKPLRSNANPNPHQRFSSELEYTKTMMMMSNNLSSSSDNRVLSEETAAASSAGSQSPINLELSLSMPSHQIEVKREKTTQDHKGLWLGSSSSSSATRDQEAAKSPYSCPCNNLALHMNVRGECDCAPATKVSVVDALQRFSSFYR